jgi:hypothetical protein
VDEIKVKVKHLSIVDYAEGMEALFTARDKKRNNDITSAENFLHISIEKFQKASMSDPNNFLNVLQ